MLYKFVYFIKRNIQFYENVKKVFGEIFIKNNTLFLKNKN